MIKNLVLSDDLKSFLFSFFSILLEVPSIICCRWSYVFLYPKRNFIVCLYDEMHVALIFANLLDIVACDMSWSPDHSIIFRILLKILRSSTNYNDFISCRTLARLYCFPINNEILITRRNHCHSLSPDVMNLTIFSKRFHNPADSVVLVPRSTVIVVSNRLNNSV